MANHPPLHPVPLQRTWSWLGVPVIRLPNDTCLLQELVWEHRAERIVETGAHGGSMVLNASLQRLVGLEPRVVGIAGNVLRHTREALANHRLGQGVESLEADSTTTGIRKRAEEFLKGYSRALLILDSRHTHDHVLAELRSLAPLLPIGSYVLVADTLTEEFPPGHFAKCPRDQGNKPLTAARAFRDERNDLGNASRWGQARTLDQVPRWPTSTNRLT